MSLPNWVLENVIAVEEAYLSPKPKLQIVGNTSELQIALKVKEKWDSFTDRHGFSERGLSCELSVYLQRLTPEQLTNINRHSFAIALGVKADSFIEIGSVQATGTIQLWFVFADNCLIEFFTRRALRTLAARAMHYSKVQPSGQREAERIHTISKHKRQIKIQGGLIKQERQPRDRWRSTKKSY